MNIRNKKVCVLTHARAGARLEKIPPVRLDAQRVSNRLLFTVPCTLLQGIRPLKWWLQAPCPLPPGDFLMGWMRYSSRPVVP